MTNYRKEYKRAWYQKNKERLQAKHRAYYYQNRDRLNEISKANYHAKKKLKNVTKLSMCSS